MLYKLTKIATICKLSDETHMFKVIILIYKLILVLNNKRMVSFFQYLELSIIPQFLQRIDKCQRNFQKFGSIEFLVILFLNDDITLDPDSDSNSMYSDPKHWLLRNLISLLPFFLLHFRSLVKLVLFQS